MTISDEQLLACIDGEIPAEERAALETRIAADPELARRFAAQLALRERLRSLFDPILEEPVPRRLLDVAAPVQIRRSRSVWFAAAASLAAGVVLGPLLLRLAGEAPSFVLGAGQLTASGALAQALSRQLAADQLPSARLRVGVSFLARNGQYCRTFFDSRSDSAIAGLACRDDEIWRLRVLESVADKPAERAPYSQAATSMPPGVVQAAEAMMIGEPLDAASEAAARASGWSMPSRLIPRK